MEIDLEVNQISQMSKLIKKFNFAGVDGNYTENTGHY